MFIIISGIQYLKVRKSKKSITKEQDTLNIQKHFERDVNGQFPWEVNTDNDPRNIPKDSKRISNNWAPKRGKW